MHQYRVICIHISKQECIPVGCVPSGGLHQAPPREQTRPRSRPPCKACWDAACNACWDSTLCKACWDTTCNACWDSTPAVNRMTNRCKNITLPKLCLRAVIKLASYFIPSYDGIRRTSELRSSMVRL